MGTLKYSTIAQSRGDGMILIFHFSDPLAIPSWTGRRQSTRTTAAGNAILVLLDFPKLSNPMHSMVVGRRVPPETGQTARGIYS